MSDAAGNTQQRLRAIADAAIAVAADLDLKLYRANQALGEFDVEDAEDLRITQLREQLAEVANE